jgi:hypothetical protein
VDAWKYRHLDNLPTLDPNPQPVSRIASSENRPGSTTFSHMAYSPCVRNAPYPLRARRSSSVNDMYQTPNSAAYAVQSLKGNRPSAVVKQIVRRSSLPDGALDPFSEPLAPQRVSSSRSLQGERKVQFRRKSSGGGGSLELTHLAPTAPSPLPKPTHSSPRSRVVVAPSLSVITDHSVEQDLSELGSLHSPQHHDRKKVRTRVFEYDENDELVEVLDDEREEKGEGGDDESYDEEYIDVIYEDEDDEDEMENFDNERHVFESTSAEVASHITWM